MLSKITKSYLESLHGNEDSLIEDLVTYATLNHIPIMESDSMDVLLHLLKLKRANKILEIGTAIGYSAIRMAQALPESKVVTIDSDDERVQQAKANVTRAQLENRVHIYCGDALTSAELLDSKGPYDALFIDAAKGQYKQYFELFAPMVHKGGIVVSDNVLFRGLVANGEKTLGRYKTIVQRLRQYNAYIVKHPDFDTTFYPIGDGMAVSIKLI